jgi:hypothetical protein
VAYKYDSIYLYYTSYLNLNPVDAWLLRYQSLEECHSIWNTAMDRSPGWTARLGNTLCDQGLCGGLMERSGHAPSRSGHNSARSGSKKRRHFGPNPGMENCGKTVQ